MLLYNICKNWNITTISSKFKTTIFSCCDFWLNMEGNVGFPLFFYNLSILQC